MSRLLQNLRSSFCDMASSAIVLALAATFLIAEAAKLPDYIRFCNRNAPDFDDCLLKSMEAIRPHLAKGIPKLKVPALEPLVIPALEINRNTDALKIKAKLKDIRAFGGTGFIVNSLKTDPDRMGLNLTITIPQLRVTSDYDVDGRILGIPLKGKGIFKGNFTNAKAVVKATAKLIKNKKGMEYLQVKNLAVKVAVQDQSVKIDNQNNANSEAMTRTLTNFYNQNKQQVQEIITPIVEETAAAFMRQFANNIFLNVPYNMIVPKRPTRNTAEQ